MRGKLFIVSRIGPASIVAAQDQVSCDLAGEVAILRLSTGVYYGLDPVGARIWALLQRPVTTHDIRDTILHEYGVTTERCERDLIGLLGRLAAEGLIKVQHDSLA